MDDHTADRDNDTFASDFDDSKNTTSSLLAPKLSKPQHTGSVFSPQPTYDEDFSFSPVDVNIRDFAHVPDSWSHEPFGYGVQGTISQNTAFGQFDHSNYEIGSFQNFHVPDTSPGQLAADFPEPSHAFSNNSFTNNFLTSPDDTGDNLSTNDSFALPRNTGNSLFTSNYLTPPDDGYDRSSTDSFPEVDWAAICLPRYDPSNDVSISVQNYNAPTNIFEDGVTSNPRLFKFDRSQFSSDPLSEEESARSLEAVNEGEQHHPAKTMQKPRCLTQMQVDVLNQWLVDNSYDPYAIARDIKILQARTNLTPLQIENHLWRKSWQSSAQRTPALSSRSSYASDQPVATSTIQARSLHNSSIDYSSVRSGESSRSARRSPLESFEFVEDPSSKIVWWLKSSSPPFDDIPMPIIDDKLPSGPRGHEQRPHFQVSVAKSESRNTRSPDYRSGRTRSRSPSQSHSVDSVTDLSSPADGVQHLLNKCSVSAVDTPQEETTVGELSGNLAVGTPQEGTIVGELLNTASNHHAPFEVEKRKNESALPSTMQTVLEKLQVLLADYLHSIGNALILCERFRPLGSYFQNYSTRASADKIVLRWTCRCGQRRSCGLRSSDDAAARRLGVRLAQQTHQESSQPSSQAVPLPNPLPSGTAVNASQTAVGPSDSRHPAFTGSPWTQVDGNTTQSLPQTSMSPRYLLLCVSKSKYDTSLGQICCHQYNNDQSLFANIRSQYDALSNSKLAWYSFMLPSKAELVKFQIIPRTLARCKKGLDQRVGILSVPSIPPPEEVSKFRRYHYEPCPLDENDPYLPMDDFMHALLDPREHTSNFWVQSLPKKLLQELRYVSTNTRAIGWGVRIVRSPNMLLITLLLIGALVSTTIFCVLWITIRGGEIQDAYSMGAFIVAAETLIFSYFFFSWQQPQIHSR